MIGVIILVVPEVDIGKANESITCKKCPNSRLNNTNKCLYTTTDVHFKFIKM